MYDRNYGDRALSFEPSGGLLEAALVMRDWETDSWWAIMQDRSIQGPMDGQKLTKLPNVLKTTWGDWRRRHPGTLVLAVEGQTHQDQNHFDSYFSSDRTYRGLATHDDRLPAKEPIFAFRIGDRPYALPHRSVAGGHLETLPRTGDSDSGSRGVLFFFRKPGASPFATTQAWVVAPEAIKNESGAYFLVDPNDDSVSPLPLENEEGLRALASLPDSRVLTGLDTYWYTWINVNPDTELLSPR